MLNKCWIWTGATNDDGYGVVGIEGKIKYVHRVSFEAIVGPVPEELELDHLCKIRVCYNPNHLEPVTHLENVRRGESFNRNKIVCKNGHEFTIENTVNRVTGGRYCRQCNRDRYQKWSNKNH
jgi:HNH endonuclease